MINLTVEQVAELQAKWTDQFVQVNPNRPELRRFEGKIGRVITVNYNGKALVDFADGAWYDITASDDCLTRVSADEAKGKFDATANSAQPIPARQG